MSRDEIYYVTRCVMDQAVLDSIDGIRDIKKITKDISKSSRSVKNRLRSIVCDNGFVSDIIPLYNNRPIVPNKRCGTWYVRPEQRHDSCYFKSTDGHNTQWDFSVKRLNLHLLPIIMENNGVVIVDSTRRGKKMPDSMSKTIPIWCCCINSVLFEHHKELMLPPGTVSDIERDAISRKIPELIEKIEKLNILANVTLDKPLRPIWCYPGSVPYEPLLECEDFHPVICCTASMQHQDGELHLNGFQYVQGAADDHELWAPSAAFNSEIFWHHFEMFENLSTDDEFDEAILQLIEEERTKISSSQIDLLTQLPVTPYTIGRITSKIDSMPSFVHSYEKVVIFTEKYRTDFLTKFSHDMTMNEKLVYFPFSANKKYYKKFREILAPLLDVLTKIDGNILVLCENGEDFSVGVILCLLCSKYDLNWHLSKNNLVTKNFVRLHLIKLMEVRPCNPQRNILNSCNSVLM